MPLNNFFQIVTETSFLFFSLLSVCMLLHVNSICVFE